MNLPLPCFVCQICWYIAFGIFVISSPPCVRCSQCRVHPFFFYDLCICLPTSTSLSQLSRLGSARWCWHLWSILSTVPSPHCLSEEFHTLVLGVCCSALFAIGVRLQVQHIDSQTAVVRCHALDVLPRLLSDVVSLYFSDSLCKSLHASCTASISDDGVTLISTYILIQRRKGQMRW